MHIDPESIEWSRSTNDLARERGVLPSAISNLRRKYAPHTIRRRVGHGTRDHSIFLRLTKLEHALLQERALAADVAPTILVRDLLRDFLGEDLAKIERELPEPT
jgi:hypothetical protein